ncbi:MAG: hypothetical protein HYV97_08705 [Bdellovibrio sp.]|nr:hypothetical protein [Bdellovibrio sp.]
MNRSYSLTIKTIFFDLRPSYVHRIFLAFNQETKEGLKALDFKNSEDAIAYLKNQHGLTLLITHLDGHSSNLGILPMFPQLLIEKLRRQSLWRENGHLPKLFSIERPFICSELLVQLYKDIKGLGN